MNPIIKKYTAKIRLYGDTTVFVDAHNIVEAEEMLIENVDWDDIQWDYDLLESIEPYNRWE